MTNWITSNCCVLYKKPEIINLDGTLDDVSDEIFRFAVVLRDNIILDRERWFMGIDIIIISYDYRSS